MSFTTGTFFIFFPLLLITYWLMLRGRWQNLLLLVGSYVFYGWIHPWYAVLLGAATLADYGFTRWMTARPASRHAALALSLLVNLGVLVFFKLSGFFSASLSQVFMDLGLDGSSLAGSLILPVGLSFYTLKKIAYVLDVHRGRLLPETNLLDFALYVSFFPQIVAGPIDRAQLLLPQIKSRRIWKAEWFHSAWPLLVGGLFKKFVIADSLNVMVNRIFYLEEPSKLLVLAATLAFTLQVLADFSAYTDLARGFAFLLGFRTSENFQDPYLSLTPTHFWNRWHITLSSWLREYLFFPLRRVLLKIKAPDWLATVLPPLVTMAVCGLWHGAGWTFLLWGLFHGVLIATYQLLGLGGAWKPAGWFKKALAWLVMFALIVFSWLLFRAPSIAWLGHVLGAAPWQAAPADRVVELITLAMTLVYALPMGLLALLPRLNDRWDWLKGVSYAILLALSIVYLSPAPPNFIYFQF